MLFAHGHRWTLRQRWLFVSATTVALAAFGILIYGYERYCRGPSDDVFYGTWQDTTPALDSITYFQFSLDHTALYLATGNGELSVIGKGRWYAGGENIYFWLRSTIFAEQQLIVRHIEDIRPNQITLREGHYAPTRFIRVTLDLSRASNQSMQPTAGRSDA